MCLRIVENQLIVIEYNKYFMFIAWQLKFEYI